jgi:hypothetical protein
LKINLARSLDGPGASNGFDYLPPLAVSASLPSFLATIVSTQTPPARGLIILFPELINAS